MTVLQVDIVVPVRNEERDLETSVQRLAGYLREGFPWGRAARASAAGADRRRSLGSALRGLGASVGW